MNQPRNGENWKQAAMISSLEKKPLKGGMPAMARQPMRKHTLVIGIENFIGGVIDKSEYFEFRNSYTKTIEGKQDALLRVKKEMKQTVTTGTTERNWVTLFKQYENVEELNRRVLMSLVDRILIHENHAIEIVFKYKDEYQQTLEYVLGYADELDIAV